MVASVGILSIFSDTVRKKIAGIVKTLDPSADADVSTGSKEIMQGLDENGLDD